jgi:hypothetical protein
LVLILFLFFARFKTVNESKPVDVLVFVFFLIFFVGIFVFLFFNHLALARKTELVIEGQQLTIVNDGKAEIISSSDILSIKEYTANRLPWGSVIKWNIAVKEKEYIISSLTISRLNFERHFHIKIETKTSLVPII